MKRLFLAIDIPEDTRDELLDLRISSNEVNWTRWENYHLTLKYLGDSVSRKVESDIIYKLNRLRFPKFSVALSSVGFFGSERAPRVLWAGIDKNPTLSLMQKEIVDSLRGLDLNLEKKKFVPHVTLGRPSRNLSYEQVAEFLKAHSTYRSEEIDVDRYFLMESQLTRQGAHYSIVEEFELEEMGDI